MNIDEVMLRAYVDGELPVEQAGEIRSALAMSKELREKEAALRRSRLPYEAAFAAQHLPDVPVDLQRRLRSWLAVGPDPFPDEPWVQAVVRYQALYVRETVERVADDPEGTRALLTAFSARTGARIAIPDLRRAGLAFCQVQRLAVGDTPLIQMMYLPAVGKPMCLWVLHAAHGDLGVNTRRADELGVTTWRRNGLACVMVADMPLGDAKALAERLASGELPVLYEATPGVS